jgi:methionine biosynthesis protein MetW
MSNSEYNKSYHEDSGLKYQKNKFFSRAYFAKKIFPDSIVNKLYKKRDEYSTLSYKEIWKNFKNNDKVLDIGCGRGLFLLAAPKEINILGVDVINTDVEICSKKGLKVTNADVEKKLPFKDESFNGVTLIHVIEHFEKPHEVIDEIKRILKKEGKIVILTPNFATDHKRFYNDPTHKKPFTKRGLFKLLNDSGFKEIEIKNDIFNSHNFLFTSLTFFPRFKIIIGKIIGKFYGLSILAIAKKE